MGDELAIEVRNDALTMVSSPQIARQRLMQLQEFVRDAMIEGIDYGTIPGTPKPTLYQPGAQKLTEIYGLAPHYEFTSRVENWESGFLVYEARCTLRSRRDDSVVGTGIGACNSMEGRYKKRSAADLQNTLMKMACKRALVHAVLGATRSSGIFTQDLEDAEPEEPKQRKVALDQRTPEQQKDAHHKLRVMLTTAKNGVDLDAVKILIGKARADRFLTEELLADLIEYGKACRAKVVGLERAENAELDRMNAEDQTDAG